MIKTLTNEQAVMVVLDDLVMLRELKKNIDITYDHPEWLSDNDVGEILYEGAKHGILNRNDEGEYYVVIPEPKTVIAKRIMSIKGEDYWQFTKYPTESEARRQYAVKLGQRKDDGLDRELLLISESEVEKLCDSEP